LATTKLNVVGTTASGAENAKEAILDGNSSYKDRLTTLDMDVCDEKAIEKVSHEVKERFGNELRLLVNVSGIVRPPSFIWLDLDLLMIGDVTASCREEPCEHLIRGSTALVQD